MMIILMAIYHQSDKNVKQFLKRFALFEHYLFLIVSQFRRAFHNCEKLLLLSTYGRTAINLQFKNLKGQSVKDYLTYFIVTVKL